MEGAMTKKIVLILGLAAIIPLTALNATAQDKRADAIASANDKYVISAKAGGVNYLEGAVTVQRKDGTSGPLLRRDVVNVGDRVSTGIDGKAEVLLNPGSYIRLGPDAEFEFKSTSLDDLQVKLFSGSAIFEVFASHEFKVHVFTPNAKMLLVESGVYRIDALADGGANLAVWEGRALVNDGRATLVKRGSVAAIKTGTLSQIRKISKIDKDDLAAWSKTRGKELAKQSSRLEYKALRTSLLSSFDRGGWGMYNSFGLWVWNPFYSGYSFLPFGWDWYSPYGYGFRNSIWGYRLPNYIVYPPAQSGGGTSVASTPVRPRRDTVERMETPPFERMQRTMPSRSIFEEQGPTLRPGGGPIFLPSRSIPPASTPIETPGTTRTLSKPGTRDN